MAEIDVLTEPQLDLGKRLINERNRLGFTQAQLSEVMGWSQTRISGYENGRRMMSLEVIYSFCEKTGADVHYMVFGEYGDPRNDPQKKTVPILPIEMDIIQQHLSTKSNPRAKSDQSRYLTLDNFYDDQAFAIEVPNEANHDVLNIGDLAIFVPADGRNIRPGAFVLASVKNDEGENLYIRRYKKHETRSEDELISSNELFPNFTFKHSKFNIIAVGIELRKFAKPLINA